MIKQWWETREPREKILVGTALFLSAIIAVWFGIVAPLMSAKSDARLELSRTVQDKVFIERALANINRQNNDVSGPAADGDVFRAAVTRAAQQRGLAIARLQNGSSGTLQLSFTDAVPIELYSWLEDISREAGGTVVSASLSARDEQVQAVIELQSTRP